MGMISVLPRMTSEPCCPQRVSWLEMVGFWSILLFEPDVIDIESRPAVGEEWRVTTDRDLTDVAKKRGSLASQGTVITVRRLVRDREEYDKTVGEAWAALSRHCKYLRQSNRRASPLPIRFNDKRVDAPFELDGPCWLTFSDGRAEGAVGLGETPSVEVYARLSKAVANAPGLKLGAGTTAAAARGAKPAPQNLFLLSPTGSLFEAMHKAK